MEQTIHLDPEGRCRVESERRESNPARAFVEEVKKAVADGSITDQLADQAELRTIIAEHRS